MINERNIYGNIPGGRVVTIQSHLRLSYVISVWFECESKIHKHIEAETKLPPFHRRHILLNKNVPEGPINNIPALVQIMASRRPGAKPLSEPMMVSLLTHIYIHTYIYIYIYMRRSASMNEWLKVGPRPINSYCGPVTPYGDRKLGQHWLR